MIKGVHHVAISCRNIKLLTGFYRDQLGFDLVMETEWLAGTELGAGADRAIGLKDSSAKVAMLSKGGCIVELFEYSSPTPKPVAPEWRVCDHGYTHICLEVEDIAAEYERLRTVGMSFHVPPPEVASNGVKAVYARDPEGNVIELLEFVSGASMETFAASS